MSIHILYMCLCTLMYVCHYIKQFYVFCPILYANKPSQPVSQAIGDVDAHPDVIKFMDPSSIEYSRALVKLKAAVSEAGVILNEDNQKLHGAVHMPNDPKQQAVSGTP